MPQPDVRALIVAGPLQNVSIAYRNRNYIGDRVFPILNASAKAKIAKYDKGAWFRDEAGPRGPGGEAPRGGYGITLVPVSTVEYAISKAITATDRRNAAAPGAPPLQLDQDAIEWCSDKIDLKKERLVASLVLGSTWSGVSGEDAEGGWAAGAGNTFIADVEARIETIRSNTGMRPNVLMLSANTLAELKQESTVLDRIKYTERGIVTADLLASLFELDEVLIGDAVFSTADEKKDGTDFSAQNIWEKNAGKGSAFLFYRPPRPGLKTPSAGYQVRVRYEDGQPRQVRRWVEPSRDNSDVYEVAEEVDIVQTASDLGFLWYDTIQT